MWRRRAWSHAHEPQMDEDGVIAFGFPRPAILVSTSMTNYVEAVGMAGQTGRPDGRYGVLFGSELRLPSYYYISSSHCVQVDHSF